VVDEQESAFPARGPLAAGALKAGCAVLLLFAASCARCGGPRSAASAEELLPPHPSGAVVTAPLGLVAQHLAALADRAASIPGGEQLGQVRQGVAGQLGFDPLTREGLLSAGLDPDRGAALAIFEAQPRPEWVVALPLTKPDLFIQTIQRLLVERAGFAPAAGPPSTARIFERGGARLALAVVRGYGMLARGADPAARLTAPAKAEESLAHAAGLLAARAQLGAQDFVVWAPAGSELPKRYTSRALPSDVAVALEESAQGIATRLFAQLPAADAAQAQAMLPGGGAALVELLPADAPLRARLGLAPAGLLASARRRPELAALLDQLHGADLETLASIAPGVVISLGVEKTANIGAAIDYGLDFRRRSPFETVQVVALAQVTDRPRLMKALESVARSLPSLGAHVARAGDDFQVDYPGGKGPRFGIRDIEGKPIAYLLGGSVKPEDLKRAPHGAAPEAAALYQDAGASVRADFGKLAAALAALPESAYGSGPQSYVARSLVSQVIEPLRPLRLTVDAQAYPDHFGAVLDLEIAAP